MSNVIRYEMSLIIKALGTPGIKAALKRHLKSMLENGAHLFNVENLGLRRLPNVFHVQGERQYEGHYFLINFNAPHDSLNQIRMMDGSHHVHCQMQMIANLAKSEIQITKRRLDEDMVTECIKGK
ncbi:uncharacterized protein Smp_203610 [Schistosoma mansoni]|uniref:uncharacterized protein n=1 Tax=Schistosoma mansoni TaxID=6183 RepID=UPI00022DCBFF|nr:uncharacterized protein Smp_203610 [Schistosoma mansoni]|eukprot:XP_018654721.1 uncharacterized protein Smp_203610 [Schistosoma mansoni]